MTSEIKWIIMKKLWGYGSVGRAPRSQRGGQRFESAYLHHKKKDGGCRPIFLSIIVRTAEVFSGAREERTQSPPSFLAPQRRDDALAMGEYAPLPY